MSCAFGVGVCQVRYRLGQRLVDRYLEFVAGRCRPNTLRAVAFDLKAFRGDREEPGAGVTATALENLSIEAVLELIATLPPHQGEVIVLRVVAGLDVGQVAQITGRRPGAVRVRRTGGCGPWPPGCPISPRASKTRAYEKV